MRSLTFLKNEKKSISKMTLKSHKLLTGLLALVLVAGMTSPAHAGIGVGSPIQVWNLEPIIPAGPHFCSIGLAADSTNLYLNGCGDPLIYVVDPSTGLLNGSFDSQVPEFPNAMAYDAVRNGLWIGAQDCNQEGMPIYFHDFDTGITTLEFTIPFGLVNPETGESFLFFCFVDGLGYNKSDPTTGVDTIYFSDDVNHNVGLFDTNGNLLAGIDARDIDGALDTQSGLAIGGSNLYLGNNGLGQVFRAGVPGYASIGQFSAIDERVEDMECDPNTFGPNEVMWVRSTPQGNPEDNVIVAYVIEPNTCAEGGGGGGGDQPIGGISAPVSATTLLVASAQANMGLWSLALVGLVGAGAAVAYKTKSKKSEQ